MQAAELTAQQSPPTSAIGVAGAIDKLSSASGVISAGLLAVFTAIVGYDVLARYLFNAGTTWVTEIGTYIFVALVFFGLAEAQRANSHVQVEILVDSLSPQRRRFVELAGLWI